MGEGGLHAGEWETSMMQAIHPEMVRGERLEGGYTGHPQEAIGALFGAGTHAIAENGVIGDPAGRAPSTASATGMRCCASPCRAWGS